MQLAFVDPVTNYRSMQLAFVDPVLSCLTFARLVWTSHSFFIRLFFLTMLPERLAVAGLEEVIPIPDVNQSFESIEAKDIRDSVKAFVLEKQSKVEYASHIINLCTSCSMEFISITYNNVGKSHQANPTKMFFYPLEEARSPVTEQAFNARRLGELNPYLSDCGLAALMRNTEREVVTQLVGSFGYSAPGFALSDIYTIKVMCIALAW
nr:protein STRUBBELIG-receptor family 8 [Tanacetum cinerariifolium]